MKFIETASAKEFDFAIRFTSSEEKFICPLCSHTRKKKTDKCVSIATAKGTGLCHHCGARFTEKKERKVQKAYIKPEWHNRTQLPDEIIKWFEGRGISQYTVNKMKITHGTRFVPGLGKKAGVIEFNYFRGDELVYIKFRTRNKDFGSVKDCEPIIYNLNEVISRKEVIIVEGEMDVLAYTEAGLLNVCSFPNGANDNGAIDHNIDIFSEAEKIYLAVDQDGAGITFREELRRRLGSERCFRVDFEDTKDSNEYLQKYGKEKLRLTVLNAQPFPIEGLVSANEYLPEILNIYEHGINPGLGTFHHNLNSLITFETGRLCVISGIPGAGKSEFVDELCENLNILHGWKTVFYSPENWPVTNHIRKLAERISGSPMLGLNRMSVNEMQEVVNYIDQNFKFILSKDEEYNLENILSVAKGAIRRHGIKIVVLDPWNRIEHQIPAGEPETNYISRMLSKISNFAQKNDVLFILVAHPRKINKKNGVFEVPTLYDISGSANFFNKADYGLTIYRNFLLKAVQVYVQKVKFRHLGGVGSAVFLFNERNGRYHPIERDPNTGEIAFNAEIEQAKFNNASHINKLDFEIPDPEPGIWDDLKTVENIPF